MLKNSYELNPKTAESEPVSDYLKCNVIIQRKYFIEDAGKRNT